jgi:heptosyltransferase-3
VVYGFDEALVAYALRVADRVVAFRQRDEALNRRLYRCVDEAPAGAEHAVLHRLRLVAALGIPAVGRRLTYRVTPDEAAAARARLAAEAPAHASPLVGMNVATYPTKLFRRWPIEQFGELSARIAAEWPHAHVLIFGGSEEREGASRLKEQLGDRATLFAGRLALRESAALMSLTDLYLGLDTGLTHVMSAFDIPLVALYHCRIPSRQIAPLDHPCLYALDHPRLGGDCTESTPMSEITVDAVLAQVRRALAEHPPLRPSPQAAARFA